MPSRPQPHGFHQRPGTSRATAIGTDDPVMTRSPLNVAQRPDRRYELLQRPDVRLRKPSAFYPRRVEPALYARGGQSRLPGFERSYCYSSTTM